LSIIIPCYNAASTIESLVDSVLRDSCFKHEDELLVIDDCSTDTSPDLARAKGAKVVLMNQNSGPSAARNRGAQEAKNDILFFLDSDTFLESGSIKAVKEHFRQSNSTPCVNGWCSMTPISPGIGQAYKGLVEYSWHMEFFKKEGNISCFNTRVGALLRQAFVDTGGFSTAYLKAEVEDYEFSYRLIKKYTISLNKKICVRHDFPGIAGTIKDYWSRAGKWMELFFNRRSFDNGGTSASNGLGHLIGALFPMVSLLIFFEPLFLLLSLFFVAAFLFLFKNFFSLVLKEKGIKFLLFCVLLHLFYSQVIFVSASLGFFRAIFKRLRLLK